MKTNYYTQLCTCRNPVRSYCDRNRCHFCGGILPTCFTDEVSETPTGGSIVAVLLTLLIGSLIILTHLLITKP